MTFLKCIQFQLFVQNQVSDNQDALNDTADD